MSFDPLTYDPFAGYDDNREIHHRINQTRARLGQSVVMPDNWAHIDRMAQDIAQADSVQISKLDRDPDAQQLAKETIDNYRYRVGFSLNSVGMRGHEGSTEIDEHSGLQYDSKFPQTMNRLYAILAGAPEALIPLSGFYTWEDVARERLSRYNRCDVRLHNGCNVEHAEQRFAIKSGEFVCIYASCAACREWFELDNFERRMTQKRQIIAFGTDQESFINPNLSTDDDDGDDPWS
ncbi:hypothetical protein [Mycobacterium colombiense]|uniref:hypothetical protein n=1 Tax=Mycobacterium colombiense TaxID=339268 RepID=UPI000AD967AE|nr:hypothetical protein [Mycobacterium colombiense]